MSTTRREFVALSITAVAGTCVSGCVQTDQRAGGQRGDPAVGSPVDVGPASLYANDGVYSAFREKGFFLVRDQAQLLAISSVCTHRGCKVDPPKEGIFHCPCHGSKFDTNGHVVRGPATRDLPRLAISENADGHLLVSAASA